MTNEQSHNAILNRQLSYARPDVCRRFANQSKRDQWGASSRRAFDGAACVARRSICRDRNRRCPWWSADSLTARAIKVTAIATRYKKLARNFPAGLHLVCALVWL